MEKEKKREKATESDFVLQWGTKKRLRCVKSKKDQNLASKSKQIDSLPKEKLTAAHVGTPDNESPSQFFRDSDLSMNNRRSSALSPEKDRYYMTRRSLGLDDNGKISTDDAKEDKGHVWPRLFIALSSKEKEEDFMAMKGCKPPHRPKKRAKLIQRTILLASPGAWLTDLCQERYQVREKKSSKKRARGLKAMGSTGSDSEYDK